MQYCKKCVEPESNCGLTFDEDGICNVCRHYEKKRTVDWNKRLGELKRMYGQRFCKRSFNCNSQILF